MAPLNLLTYLAEVINSLLSKEQFTRNVRNGVTISLPFDILKAHGGELKVEKKKMKAPLLNNPHLKIHPQ